MLGGDKGWIGLHFSKKHKKCLSESNRGKHQMTPDIKRKLLLTHLGIPLKDETKKKLSIALRGREISKTHRDKISKALKGKVRSKEHCINLSKAIKGSKHTEEARRKMRMHSFMKGKRHSRKMIKLFSDIRKNNPIKYMLGKHHSLETRKKISLSHKKRFKNMEKS
jgi:hypothetical protein